ncbi:MAG: 5-bromo-4-chloroindolyl phosphate hydrolysis family protein [Bacilli bacterium]|nr:5-bromo-4-chloroindolyl phosphate hydrolysis family protein [Bacilli bacterium]
MNRYVLSGIIGGAFFAVPYLALNISLAPSLATATIAFAASALATKQSNLDKLGKKNLGIYKELLENSKINIKQLKSIIPRIDNETLKTDVIDITKTSEKIISRLEKTPEKISQATNFLNYYLPITLKILSKYEEIENENLTSKEVKNFMERITNLIDNIKGAFQSQLNNLYSTDMVDIDAEMKVFESILKSDGLLGETIKTKEGDNNGH